MTDADCPPVNFTSDNVPAAGFESRFLKRDSKPAAGSNFKKFEMASWKCVSEET